MTKSRLHHRQLSEARAGGWLCKNLLQVWITHDSTRCNLEANLHLA